MIHAAVAMKEIRIAAPCLPNVWRDVAISVSWVKFYLIVTQSLMKMIPRPCY